MSRIAPGEHLFMGGSRRKQSSSFKRHTNGLTRERQVGCLSSTQVSLSISSKPSVDEAVPAGSCAPFQVAGWWPSEKKTAVLAGRNYGVHGISQPLVRLKAAEVQKPALLRYQV